jgi:hypothetical protein
MSSNISRPTSFVEDATMVQNTRAAIQAKLRGIPRVDKDGRDLAGPDPTVTAVVESPVVEGQSPSMAEALRTATTALGVDLTALVDSNRFVKALGSIEAGDIAALEAAINDAVTANPGLAIPRPGMRPKPAQGGSGSVVVTPSKPLTPAQRIAAQLSKLPTVDPATGHPVN